MSKEEREYWFKPKRYGWGWGLPQTRQGWISFGIFIAVWLGALAIITPTDEKGISHSSGLLFAGIMVLDVAGLVYVSVKHGEPPKWRWGGKTKSKRKG